MENERRTEYNVDMRPEEDFLSDILSASQIRATDTYETPPQIIWIDNSTIATLGNFSASTGKAKSKKTFNVSAIVAASLAGKQVLNYRAHLPEGKRKILYVDTEQSRFHCHNVLERILRLAGLPTTTDSENLDFICLREYSPAIRIGVIDYALRQRKGYGLVIIDGIRDLMLDINSTGESVEVINKMMEWSSKYDLHIHCVLHLNKGDNNVRGHIGTEMSNKAETVLVISKNNDCPNISEVHALHIREKEFKPFAFTVNEGGLPAEGDVAGQVVSRQHDALTESGGARGIIQQHDLVVGKVRVNDIFLTEPVRVGRFHLIAQMLEETLDGFAVPLIQTAEVAQREYTAKSSKPFFFQMFPNGIAGEEER